MVKKGLMILPGMLLLAAMLVTGCSGTAGAKTGDTVKVHYTGSLEDGTVFDTSVGGEPLAFTLGEGLLIPGFEQAVTGMVVGETKTVTILADEAYGPYLDDRVLVVQRDQLPEDQEPEVGGQVQLTLMDGGILIATITEVTETTVTIDANPPLAGMDLTFEIELVEIE